MTTGSRLRARDLGELALFGVRARPVRAVLSAIGIAIGVASIVAVLGISTSAQADLLAKLDALGTNLLQAQANTSVDEQATLPPTATDSVRNIGPVESVSSVADVEADVYRNELVPKDQSQGIMVKAVDPDLLDVLKGAVADGVFIDDANGAYPAVVLGAVTAQRLGIGSADLGAAIVIDGVRFVVVGILQQLELSPDLDRSALVGYPVAVQKLGLSGEPTTVYVRADPDHVEAVAAVLNDQINPAVPGDVTVSRPSDALVARAATEEAFTGLLLGLGAVSLVVGGVGVANVMVMGVLERRGEIGLRRAIGATRAHIRRQFLTESVVLAGVGGAAGVLLGGLVTGAYAFSRDLPVAVPAVAIAGGTGIALALGAVAGLYPAVKAARLSPVEALRAG
ncbi:ABC transporter permease [Jiangella muralis]|uniref:ABC transporter permease n=1 Tax=Jiangella muralis TaxID=702383 RepID=UPI00069DA1C5|nr:ABC transporter permease [Jiangella muralis]